MKVKELLEKKEKWAKGCSYRNEAGEPCLFIGAKSYCLLGAIYKVHSDSRERDRAEGTILDAIKKLFPNRFDWCSIPVVSFNDHPDTTFEDVQKVLELADV